MAKSQTKKTADPQPAASLDVDDAPPAETADRRTSGRSSAQTPPPRGRQGDDRRPHCPNCSTADAPVLMEAVSSPPLFTWYACPNRPSSSNPDGECDQPRVKLPRPEQQQQYNRFRQRQAVPRTDER